MTRESKDKKMGYDHLSVTLKTKIFTNKDTQNQFLGGILEN